MKCFRSALDRFLTENNFGSASPEAFWELLEEEATIDSLRSIPR